MCLPKRFINLEILAWKKYYTEDQSGYMLRTEELDLEIPLSNGKFTWSSLGVNLIHSLLDRFFVLKSWDHLWDNSRAFSFRLL